MPGLPGRAGATDGVAGDPRWGRSSRPPRSLNADLVARVAALIQAYPTFGYCRLWALLRFREGPRVQGRQSVAATPNTRWAVDVTHIPCGPDGWAHLTAVVDYHDRAVVGYEFALRGRAQEAERTLEEACLTRFGTVRPRGPTPALRSDNGLIFQSRRFRAACRTSRLRQEFLTPYTPEQNGVIEWFFRSLREECVWHQVFSGYQQACQGIRRWIAW